ncbi:PrsW family glutamic-type intramembrane protease [Anaerosalibacter bizertensis]|uniref:Protease PrsW n=1 Tax=Anaerosalibacter bizertensis TaxID=932217 RepID=A0A9Q4AEA3_9FIRM|nr:PrsW family glutamic-type intramembrane protease [Anaerosalibacter bizertensis]MBV1819493.1 PrsW family intramembrane metalloprotease [Bacteroidales bacterium MSK.15.36]HHV27559.1 PrsW family intramembrane metalloprotease [Tissierellia bacterium]MCB5560196.1 PrsW family intramembrane metalloprotease [Anaerosalibacter bizertensis]MCG4565844.1 PrsW family glutamic-type intramembrane protease [Anaerosalibacter bizertensis]MCG4583102.1 PrsW family glutamic-type intramembrane protease [Anaerosal
MSTRLFIIAITPALVITVGLYLSDRYDKEPLKLLLITYILGALSVIPTIFVEELLTVFNVFPGILGAFYTAFIVAGFTEEYFKRLVVLKVAYKSKYFNEKLDGIVYAVFASMGFATIENVIYVVYRYSNNPYIGLYRGILSVPAHGVFAVTMGYYLSLAKFSTIEERKRRAYRRSLYMPIIFHGIFDFILMANIPQLTIIFVPYVIYLWWLNERKLSKYLYDSRSRFIGTREKRK